MSDELRKDMPHHCFEILDQRLKDEHAYYTYGQMKAVLDKMTPEQLAQPIQVMPPHLDDNTELQPIVSFNMVGHFCSTEDGKSVAGTRGCIDNAHHPEHYVLLSDYLPFDEDGNTSFIWDDDMGNIGDKTGDRYYDNCKVTLRMDGDNAKTAHIQVVKSGRHRESKVVRTEELIPGWLLAEYDGNNQFVGLEILSAFPFKLPEEDK